MKRRLCLRFLDIEPHAPEHASVQRFYGDAPCARGKRRERGIPAVAVIPPTAYREGYGRNLVPAMCPVVILFPAVHDRRRERYGGEDGAVGVKRRARDVMDDFR